MTVQAPPVSSDKDRVTELFRVMLPYYIHERAHDWRFLAQQRRVCAMLSGRAGRALDIGCGSGLMTEALVERGWEVWGLDLLESAVAWARSEAEMITQPGPLRTGTPSISYGGSRYVYESGISG